MAELIVVGVALDQVARLEDIVEVVTHALRCRVEELARAIDPELCEFRVCELLVPLGVKSSDAVAIEEGIVVCPLTLSKVVDALKAGLLMKKSQ